MTICSICDEGNEVETLENQVFGYLHDGKIIDLTAYDIPVKTCDAEFCGLSTADDRCGEQQQKAIAHFLATGETAARKGVIHEAS